MPKHIKKTNEDFIENPSNYAESLGVLYATQVSEGHKKSLGQFFTPLPIARFMATFGKFGGSKIRILDPGCGIGILSTSLIENLILEHKQISTIELVAFETDINILPLAEKNLRYLSAWLNHKGIEFTFFLCKNDFILHNSPILNNQQCIDEFYDIIICNPPYFKLPKGDERINAAKSVIFGQSNIYTIFLIIATKLLKDNGQLIFITPRSFCSGSYFRLFREIFFSTIDLHTVHLFDSRKEAFKRDKVLQENIIINAMKKRANGINQLELSFPKSQEEIIISSSKGIADINNRRIKKYKISSLINFNSYQKILHLPSSETDEQVISIFKTWTGSLNAYDLEVSTGPVVDFRSEGMIFSKKIKGTVPLIWLHNVEPMKLIWPREGGYKGKVKNQYIISNEISRSRLVENKNYVLIRRFSSKEDSRRLVAAPYIRDKITSALMIGIENHLNYVYNIKTELAINEVIGICAILNSRLFDLYFRTFNGNINVSATELRDFPLPSYDLIRLLGDRIIKLTKDKEPLNIDFLVSEFFKLPIDLSKAYG